VVGQQADGVCVAVRLNVVPTLVSGRVAAVGLAVERAKYGEAAARGLGGRDGADNAVKGRLLEGEDGLNAIGQNDRRNLFLDVLGGGRRRVGEEHWPLAEGVGSVPGAHRHGEPADAPNVDGDAALERCLVDIERVALPRVGRRLLLGPEDPAVAARCLSARGVAELAPVVLGGVDGQGGERALALVVSASVVRILGGERVDPLLGDRVEGPPDGEARLVVGGLAIDSDGAVGHLLDDSFLGLNGRHVEI